MTHFLLTFSTSCQLISFSFFNLPSEEELKIISLRHFPTLIHSLFSIPLHYIPLPLSIPLIYIPLLFQFPSTTFPFSFNSPPLHSSSLSIPLHYIHLSFRFPSTTFTFPFDSPPLHSSSLLLNKVFSYTICFVT